MNQETKASLHTLLNIAHLDNLCHEEKNTGSNGKSNSPIELLLKIHMKAGKNVLDPKCKVNLKCNKI